MVKKILNILKNIVIGIVIFYFFVALIVIPVAAPIIIKIQGTKALKTPVTTKSVTFNPFLWRLTVKEFAINDENKNTMVGFDRFSVDVGILALIKKVYTLQSVYLDGLQVNAVLLKNNEINLLKLVPAPAENKEAPAPTKEDKQVVENQAEPQTQPLPNAVIELVELRQGRIQFEDTTITPTFKGVLGDINIKLTNVSTNPEALTTLNFSAKIDDKGAISAQAQAKALKEPPEIEATFNLDSYAMTVLAPYVGKYTGRDLADGKLDVTLTYTIAQNQIKASHQLLIQKFTFGQKVESKDALNLPFGLAVALLEDPSGRIKISLPVEGDLSDPKFKYSQAVWQVIRNFFVKLMTKPFSMLGSILGSEEGTDELGSIRFTPGKFDLLAEEQQKIAKLAQGLKDRPKLSLEINGGYDPKDDWKAIKNENLVKDFNELKGESTKLDSWVYQQLYQRRFGVRELWKVNNAFKEKDGTINEEKLNAEIKRQLIEDAPADKVAMDTLAQARSKVIYDAFIAAGADTNRVKIGNPRQTQASMGFVPTEFTLTIFGDSDKPEEPPIPTSL